MIGHLSKFLAISCLIFSCTPKPEDDCENCSAPVDTSKVVETNLLDESLMNKYIDQVLVPNALIYQNQASNDYCEVEVDSVKYEILAYEGRLMSASGSTGGFTLYFEPFNQYDDALEMEIESKYQFKLTAFITKNQNDHLHFIDYTKETKNIAWDYFENLFTIYYYLNEQLDNVPLKFVNLGKTEWDG
jgi:hypothetical protein